MTWSDAAEKVLRREAKPLNWRELTKKILERNLVRTKSKLPQHSFYASIKIENRRAEEKGLPPRFILEAGDVRLAEWEVTESNTAILDRAMAQRSLVRAELLRRLRQLSPQKFESYIDTRLYAMGYQVEPRGGPTDQGIDCFCELQQGINEVKTAVQVKCKQPHNKIGPKDIYYLRECTLRDKCSQGVFITTSTFTREAQRAAEEEGKLRIILIDGNRLAELALEHEVGTKSQSVKTYFLDKEFELLMPPPRRGRHKPGRRP